MTKDRFKIVSLILSGTERLAALGLADVIVGRSHECDFPSYIKNIPACTQTRLNINAASGEISIERSRLESFVYCLITSKRISFFPNYVTR